MKMRFLIVIWLSPFFACAQKAAVPPPKVETKPAATQEAPKLASELVERGKKVYRMNCLQCHNADPRKAGSQGPANYGSSLELLQAKVLKRQYPAGYKPQRKTSIMPAMPFLAKDIEALHAYLNSAL